MRILHLSTTDIKGGAARATYRLHQGLHKLDAQSYIYVQSRLGDDPYTVGPLSLSERVWGKLKSRLDKAPLALYPDREQLPYSVQWVPGDIRGRIREFDPDIVHLHWICAGYISIEAIARLKSPLIWTLHDMWPFTGGCHYDQGCGRYAEACGKCPLLHSDMEHDLSRWIWWRKHKAWQQLDLTLVAPSRWLASCAQRSSLFRDSRIEVIPNGMNVRRFKPVEKSVARETLNLPQHTSLVLFGAMDPKSPLKGYELLHSALKHLEGAVCADDLAIAIFGNTRSESTPDWWFDTHYLGYFSDDPSLALVYSAADVMVVPSRQEAFGQTASEALACGTPVVAFDAAGLKDIVDHQQNGYLAEPFKTEDLAHGIQWVLERDERRRILSQNARQKAVREFDQELQAQRYLQLYEHVLKRRSNALSNTQ